MQILLLYLANLLEGFSFVAGIYYLRKYPNDLSNKLFTSFLLFTYAVEIIGLIPALIYHHQSLYHLKETMWYSNFWLFNPYLIVSFAFYCYYFSMSLKSIILKRVLNISIIFYVISSVLILITSGVLFNSYSNYTLFLGVILLFISISSYYYELLQNDMILEIRKIVKFYVSISFLLFNLISMPLWIYFEYFSNTISPEFVKLYQTIFYISNTLLYSTYIFAFIYCAKANSTVNVLRDN